MTATAGRVCPTTGFYVEPATRHPFAWRVAKEHYVRVGGINAVRRNGSVGPLPPANADVRGRFDTVGRTVYFGKTQQAAFAEVLQAFRQKRAALEADAAAAGFTVDQYIKAVIDHTDRAGVDRPWAIGADWQMARCLHKVSMPSDGWWVRIDHRETMNQLTLDLASLKPFDVETVKLSIVTHPDRAVTTHLADHIRNSRLFDASAPLGIVYPSNLGYGTCYAWWDRRADDGLTPGVNDPSTIEDFNVDTLGFRAIAKAFSLDVLPGRPRY